MAALGGFGSFSHLAMRFFGALSSKPPEEADEVWALSYLEEGEKSLWFTMSGADRRHAVGVGRETLSLLNDSSGSAPSRAVVAAALLHDVGKIDSGLGTFSRVGVTLLAVIFGRSRVISWCQHPWPSTLSGAGRRIASYLCHDAIGAQLLKDVGSDPLTVAWAAEHHMPEERWSVDRAVGSALKLADGD